VGEALAGDPIDARSAEADSIVLVTWEVMVASPACKPSQSSGENLKMDFRTVSRVVRKLKPFLMSL
jgi:hypothetical protein